MCVGFYDTSELGFWFSCAWQKRGEETGEYLCDRSSSATEVFFLRVGLLIWGCWVRREENWGLEKKKKNKVEEGKGM